PPRRRSARSKRLHSEKKPSVSPRAFSFSAERSSRARTRLQLGQGHEARPANGLRDLPRVLAGDRARIHLPYRFGRPQETHAGGELAGESRERIAFGALEAPVEQFRAP